MSGHAAEVLPGARSKSVDHRVPELDGIRSIAIWMVLLAHAFLGFTNAPGALSGMPWPLYQFISHGWLGVDLFFLLSGFLITGILVDAKERPRYFRNFYIRRFLRIMPLYFTVIAVWWFFYTNARAYFVLASVFGANLAYLLGVHEPHGPGVLWSLAVEEHFYLLWPLIVLVLSRRQLFAASAAIFIAMPIARGIFAARGMNPDMIYVLSWFRFDGLAGGAMLVLWAKSSAFSSRNGTRLAIALFFAAAVITIVGAPFGVNASHTTVSVALRYTQSYLLFGALFAFAVSHTATAWTAPLRWRFMQLTGALSYCLYLVHLSLGDGYEWFVRTRALDPVQRFGPSGAVLVRAGVMVITSFVLALLSRRYLEEPFLSLKDRFARRREVVTASQPAIDLGASSGS